MGSRSEIPPPSESGKKKTGSQMVSAVIIFILSGSLILASLFFLNFTVSSFGGSYPYQTTDVQRPISIQPSKSLIFNIAIRYVRTGSYSVGTFENNTFYFDKNSPLPSLDSWDTARLWFGLEQTNQTNDTLDITLFSQGSRVFLVGDYKFQGYTQLFRDETSQADTYNFQIINNNSTVINPVLHVHLEWDTYEKPYFTIGIAGLLIALLSPIMALKINRRLVGLILAIIGFVLMISGTILFAIQPYQQVHAPVYCCVYIGHPIYCLRALHGVFFDVGWLLIIVASIMLLFYRKRKLWQLTEDKGT